MPTCQHCFTIMKTGNFCSYCGKPLPKSTNPRPTPVAPSQPFVSSKTSICPFCNSDKITYWQMSGDWSCHHCSKCFRHPNEINPSDKSKYLVLSRDEVNPVMVSICNKCYSDNLITCQREGTYCKNCGSWPKVLQIKEAQRSQYPIKTRDEVNPVVISICKFCHSDQVHITGPQWDIVKFCSNCAWNACQTIQIKMSEYNTSKYPLSITKYPGN